MKSRSLFVVAMLCLALVIRADASTKKDDIETRTDAIFEQAQEAIDTEGQPIRSMVARSMLPALKDEFMSALKERNLKKLLAFIDNFDWLVAHTLHFGQKSAGTEHGVKNSILINIGTLIGDEMSGALGHKRFNKLLRLLEEQNRQQLEQR